MHLSKNCNSITLSNLATNNKSAFIALILLVGYTLTNTKTNLKSQENIWYPGPRLPRNPLPFNKVYLRFSTKYSLSLSADILVYPVEYAVVQSPVKLLVSSSCGSSMPESTSSGIMGSHSNTRSSVVWDTEIGDGSVKSHS